MKEKAITAAIVRYLKTLPECFFWKEHGGMYGTAGLPDLICCIKGRFVAFEVKTPAGRLSGPQEAAVGKIRAAGGTARVVRSVADVKAALKESGLAPHEE
jgi:hypothetical protein